MRKTWFVLFGALFSILFCSISSAQVVSPSDLNELFFKARIEREIKTKLAYVSTAIESYNQLTSEDKKIVAWNHLVVEGGPPPILLYDAVLADGTECEIQAFEDQPVNAMGDIEAPFNAQYRVIELQCSNNQSYQILKTIEGQDILDNINPGRNNGTISYAIL